MLPVKSVSPPYTAVIEWDPAASEDVLSDAVFGLPPLSVRVPSTVAPSLKVTPPLGVALPFAATIATVAVNVTDTPNADGFWEDVTLVVVVPLTVKVSRVAFAALPPLSGTYFASINCDPATCGV